MSANDNGDCCRRVQSLMPQIMQEEAPEQDQPLPPAAKRALVEAAERRKEALADRPKEIGGRAGPDPVRYGDWESKGIAHDF